MKRLPPRSTRPYTLFPYTTRFRSGEGDQLTGGITVALAGVDHAGLIATILPLSPGENPSSCRGAGMAAIVMHDPIVMPRSEEHTSEIQSLMRISYAVFCLKKKKKTTQNNHKQTT